MDEQKPINEWNWVYQEKIDREVVIDQPMWRLIYKHVKAIRLKDFFPHPKKPKQ